MGKSIETEGRSVGNGGRRRGEMQSDCLMGTGFRLG